MVPQGLQGSGASPFIDPGLQPAGDRLGQGGETACTLQYSGDGRYIFMSVVLLMVEKMDIWCFSLKVTSTELAECRL